MLLLTLPGVLVRTENDSGSQATELRHLYGWTVRVDPDLEVEEDLRDAALELLGHELYEAARALPPEPLERLRQVPIRLSLDSPWPGGVYHPSRPWLEDHGHDPTLAGCVQIGNARNFLVWERTQPSMLLHELAHAWHHQVIGHDDDAVRAAFENAVESGRYESVLRNRGGDQRAYALTNAQEYVAELSEAYLGTNDFYPFVRAELERHDAEGFALMQAIWGD